MLQYRPCPKCASDRAKAIGFTWWGGIVGPKMLTHVKCTKCGTAYNGKTGKSNQTAIAIYVTVSTVVAIVAVTILSPSRQQNNPATSSGLSRNLDRVAIVPEEGIGNRG
ncbi:hypothetical protein [Chamaesiphon sp. OTE_20_metabat_361]|uniref:hypothetical protein n=1 Tax=Chamaesiphon sp. OTE_20_metabat_361 TaxID=2964689 RepID=UPI00286A7B80|nr:hypothetical protein [Chamaesiphon sp. OTE_20_metabat_361]